MLSGSITVKLDNTLPIYDFFNIKMHNDTKNP